MSMLFIKCLPPFRRRANSKSSTSPKWTVSIMWFKTCWSAALWICQDISRHIPSLFLPRWGWSGHFDGAAGGERGHRRTTGRSGGAGRRLGGPVWWRQWWGGGVQRWHRGGRRQRRLGVGTLWRCGRHWTWRERRCRRSVWEPGQVQGGFTRFVLLQSLLYSVISSLSVACWVHRWGFVSSLLRWAQADAGADAAVAAAAECKPEGFYLIFGSSHSCTELGCSQTIDPQTHTPSTALQTDPGQTSRCHSEDQDTSRWTFCCPQAAVFGHFLHFILHNKHRINGQILHIQYLRQMLILLMFSFFVWQQQHLHPPQSEKEVWSSRSPLTFLISSTMLTPSSANPE